MNQRQEGMSPQAVTRLCLAVLQQWKDDHKPKSGEQAVKQYAKLLMDSYVVSDAPKSVRTGSIVASVRHVLNAPDYEGEE